MVEGLTALEEIRGLDNLNTSEVTDMSRMFAGCGALRSLDVSRFDTLNVKQMQQMFMGMRCFDGTRFVFLRHGKSDEHARDVQRLQRIDHARPTKFQHFAGDGHGRDV